MNLCKIYLLIYLRARYKPLLSTLPSLCRIYASLFGLLIESLFHNSTWRAPSPREGDPIHQCSPLSGSLLPGPSSPSVVFSDQRASFPGSLVISWSGLLLLYPEEPLNSCRGSSALAWSCCASCCWLRVREDDGCNKPGESWLLTGNVKDCPEAETGLLMKVLVEQEISSLLFPAHVEAFDKSDVPASETCLFFVAVMRLWVL